MKFTYEFPRPSNTVDLVIFGIGRNPVTRVLQLEVLLIERADEPFKGCWALPGGFVNVRDDGDQGEDLEAAARRELLEEASIQPDHLEQLATFGTPGRDPRGRVISVAYLGLVRSKDHVARAGSDAARAEWSLVNEVLRRPIMAFDHKKILQVGLARLRGKVSYAPIGFNLLPPKFTLPELQALYETILDRPLEKKNFRRKMRTILVECGLQERTGRSGPAAIMYRFDKRAYDKAVREGFDFKI